MSALWRLSKRRTRFSWVGLTQQQRTNAATGPALHDAYFGITFIAETGQGAQTSDIVGDVVSAAGATITTGQGAQTSDGVFVIASDAALDTGQGDQTSDVVATTPFVATVDTGQGDQTSDASFGLTAFQLVVAEGWWDSATITTHHNAGLWRISPRTGRSPLVELLTQRAVGEALYAVAGDAEFTPPLSYADGFGTPSVVPSPYTIHVSVTGMRDDAFGTASFANLTRVVYAQRIDPTLAFGAPTVVGPRYISGATAGNQHAFGSSSIVGARTVYPNSASDSSDFGLPSIAFSTRDVRPASILVTSNQVPEPVIGNSARAVEPIGISDLTAGLGDPIVAEPPFNVIEHAGAGDAGAFGDLDTALAGTVRRIRTSNNLHPVNVPAFGLPRIEPHTIHPGYIPPGSYGNGGVIGPESFGVTRISNWIRYIDLDTNHKGISSWKTGTPRVSNWIRYITPTGWDHSEVWFNFNPPPDGQLANVRHVSDGKLYPGSINDGAFGEPSVRVNLC